MFRRPWRALLAVVACAASLALLAPAAGATLPVGNFAIGLSTELLAPTSMPPGANNWSCKPSSAHPYPVILVHGTLANEAFTWQALSPMLVNAGYCVYAFNYGANSSTLGHFYGLTDIGASAGELSTFVNQVLASTGATKVDLVGHSQGGMMPRYYIKDLGGAAKVNMLIGLAPSNHGTTLDGLNTLVNDLTVLGIPAATLLGCVSCTEQIVPSSVITQLNAGTEAPAGPKYVVIESKYDEIVTPYTSAFLSGANVQNILLQNQCGLDYIDHIGIPYDPVALQDVMNALGANSPTFHPTCTLVLPVVG
jgi:triacylglycerol esterase/lipase EstA (alpha/beta hydrolase family)